MVAEKKRLKGINRRLVTVRLVGITPLILHKWDEKAKQMMRDKQQSGRKVKERALRDPEAEGEAACYRSEDGRCGVPAMAVKSAIVDAAHNDMGFPKTLVRKALFIFPPGRNVVISLENCDDYNSKKKKKGLDYVLEEDMVTVGGSADFRYRPYFYDWAVTTKWELDIDLLQLEDFLILVERAGYGVGLCEWRPQKGGEYGRFRIDTRVSATDAPME